MAVKKPMKKPAPQKPPQAKKPLPLNMPPFFTKKPGK